MNLRTDIKLDSFIEIAKEAEEFFKRELPGRYHKIEPIPDIASNKTQ